MDYPPSPCIPLNGTLSYGTAGGTNLTYVWNQTSGPPLSYLCDSFGFFTTRAFFDTDQPVSCFVPPSVGYYCFQLIVYDGAIVSNTALACVQVNPDFGQPPSTFTPIQNYTDPPLRNVTPPTRPNITFPPTTNAPFDTFPPVADSPTSPIIPPPFIPTLPNVTNTEVFILFSLFGGWILIIAFFFLIWMSYGTARFTGHLQRRVWGRDSST